MNRRFFALIFCSALFLGGSLGFGSDHSQLLGRFIVVDNGGFDATLVVDPAKPTRLIQVKFQGTVLGQKVDLAYDEAKIRKVAASGRDEVLIRHLGVTAMSWRPLPNLTSDKCGSFEIGFLKGIGNFKRVQVECVWNTERNEYSLEYLQPRQTKRDRLRELEVTLKELPGLGPVGLRQVIGVDFNGRRIPIAI